MDIGNTLQVKNALGWRDWLTKNNIKEKEIWLLIYKKSAGKPGITIEEAIDEALCFGWIDSIEKRFNEESYALRFTPRKKSSNWSARNLKRIEDLTRLGKMTKWGLAKIPHK